MVSKFERDQVLTAVKSADKSKRNDSGEVKKQMNTEYIKIYQESKNPVDIQISPEV